MSLTTKQVKYRTIGPGLLQFQPFSETESDWFTELEDYASVRMVKIGTVRSKVQDKEGGLIVAEDIAEEVVSIEAILAENSPTEKISRLGVGEVTTEAAAPGTSEEEYKTLTEEAFEALYGKDISNVAVYTTDATPVQLTVTSDPEDLDGYDVLVILDSGKEGSAAIRRIDGGSVNSGDQVKVEYDWDKPEMSVVYFGGDTAMEYYNMRHVKKLRDGTRMFTDFWKVGPAGEDMEEYEDGKYSTPTYKFTPQAVSSKPEGQQYYRKRYEAS